jgi:hypothetical protein
VGSDRFLIKTGSPAAITATFARSCWRCSALFSCARDRLLESRRIAFGAVAGRRKEIAVRLALGSNSGRLLRQLLLENVLIGAIGGLAGLLCAAWLWRVFWP